MSHYVASSNLFCCIFIAHFPSPHRADAFTALQWFADLWKATGSTCITQIVSFHCSPVTVWLAVYSASLPHAYVRLFTSPFFAISTIADSQARHPPLVQLSTHPPQGPSHSLMPTFLKILRQPAVSMDQNPSLPALPPRIVPIRSASSCSPHQYAVNYPHSLLLLHSPLYAQDSAL
ncbi:hypothetical protein C8J57DRAFT_1529880 [Mycena rebaudengoi]|nr:hypothetical protein C8J57DRAFT_1529880 [Mycena rebaudengoi]